MHKSGIGEKMKYFHFTSISLLLIVSAAFSEDSGIYLCIDSMKQQFSETGKPPQKLVYGYIDGKKTECMSEYELRAELSRISFQQSSASVPDSQQLLEMNGLKENCLLEAETFISQSAMEGRISRGLIYADMILRVLIFPVQILVMQILNLLICVQQFLMELI